MNTLYDVREEQQINKYHQTGVGELEISNKEDVMTKLKALHRYRIRGFEKSAFYQHWVGPDTVVHGDLTLIARYESVVDVYVTATPDRVFKLNILGTDREIICKTNARYAAQLAQQIMNGRIIIK